jgi:hypothetical protein
MALESNVHQPESNVHQPESNVHQPNPNLHEQVSLTDARIALVTYAEQKQDLDSIVCGKSFGGPQELKKIFVQCRAATPRTNFSMYPTPKYCLLLLRCDKAVKINGSGEDSDDRQKGGLDFKKSKPSQRTTAGVTKRTSKNRPREKRNDISMAHRRPGLRRET